MRTKLWSEILKGKDRLKGLGIDGKNIGTDLREMCCEGVDWIRLDQDRNQWRALVNAVMGLRVP